MSKPSTYNLGAIPELRLLTTDTEGVAVVPTLARLSIEDPLGAVITVSGGAMTAGEGYLAYLYEPETVGFYKYEGWVKDSTGREGASANGFNVTDRVL